MGTSSLRRKAQLLHAHPHLNVVPVRGNIDARVKMLQDGQLDAIVLAAAGEWAWCVRQSVTRALPVCTQQGVAQRVPDLTCPGQRQPGSLLFTCVLS